MHACRSTLEDPTASDLLSAAVRRAGEDDGVLELELVADETLIRVSVADGAADAPAADDPSMDLVGRIAMEWGVEDYLLGRRVWAHIMSSPG